MVEVCEEEACQNASYQGANYESEAVQEEKPVGPVDSCIKLEGKGDSWVQASFSEGESVSIFIYILPARR